MKGTNHIVAFIDILGFKNMIENHFNGKEKKNLDSLIQAMREAEKFAINQSKNYYKHFSIKVTFKQFSDCVSISMSIKEKGTFTPIILCGVFITIVNLFHFSLLANNILVRGGVAIAGHFENANMIFSKALVNAYKLESENAIYPRILLDNSVLELIEKELKLKPDDYHKFYNIFGKSFIRDWDNAIFISPFDIALEKKFIKNTFDSDEIKEKVNTYQKANKLEIKTTEEFISGIDKMDIQSLISYQLSEINEFLIQKPKEKMSILVKYVWLKEFMTWTLEPLKSRIKFERYFERKN